MADARRTRSRHRGRIVVLSIAAAVIVCLAGGGGAWAALKPQAPSYRLASATAADVTQTASLAGTVQSATRSDRAFQVSGTVAKVDVKVGDTITAGQTLATLDTSVLDDAVTQAQQSVTTAQQQLSDDLASQTENAATSTSAASAATSSDAANDGLATGTFVASAPAPASSGTSVSTVQKDVAAVQSAQDALLGLYDDGSADTGNKGVTALTTDASSQLDAVKTSLAAFATTGDCKTFTDDASTDPTKAGQDLAACQSAVSSALSTDASNTALTQLAQDLAGISSLNAQIAAAEKALTSAMTTLDSDAKSLQTSSGSTPKPSASQSAGGGSKPTTGGSGSSSQPSGGARPDGTTGGTAGTGTGSGSRSQSGSSSGSTRGGSTGGSSSSGSGSAGASSRTTTVATAADITSDEASVAAAQANLAVAQQNVSLATLTSPIAGTVAAVGVSAGSSVTAQSSSQVISVIGDDGWIVDTAVSASAIGPLKVGQSAHVSVSGVSGTLTGKVSAIGFLNTSTDSSTPSYDVKLALSGSGAGLLNGASARLTVKVDSASDVLTVPSSAVHLGAGKRYSVDVVADGKEVAREVKVGAIGPDRTQVTSGLSAGDRVVLADLSSTVSSDSTQSSTGGSGLGGLTGGSGGQQVPGGGGFGGAGRFGGGAGG